MPRLAHKTKSGSNTDFEEALSLIKDVLQLLALASGYLLLGFGYCLFFVATMELLCKNFGSPLYFVGWFHTAGYWIIPGWLLLRFAAGLFPFSLKLSQFVKVSLS